VEIMREGRLLKVQLLESGKSIDVELKYVPQLFAFAAAFFFTAHRFFIAIESAFRPAGVRPRFLPGAEVLAGAAALGATAIGTAASAAFAALIAAHRFFVPAIIACLPAALIFRLAGAVGPALAGGFESCSTDGITAFRPGPGVFSVVVGP
jgi:hypothetical protein